MDKKNLRKKYIEERNNLTENYRKQASDKIIASFLALDSYKNAKTVFSYVDFGSEVKTRKLLEKMLEEKVVYVPKIINKEMKLVQLKSLLDVEQGHFGIFEPKNNNFYNDGVDLVITPSVVFAKDGYRLGYGKGYYDKYFATGKVGTTVGLSYEKMLVTSVPREKHDRAVDIIVTEERIIENNSNN